MKKLGRIPFWLQILLTVLLIVFSSIGGLIFWISLAVAGTPFSLQVLLLSAGAMLILFLILKLFRVG